MDHGEHHRRCGLSLPTVLAARGPTDPRVRSDATADEMINTAAGVTEAFAAVASTGSVCIGVSFPPWTNHHAVVDQRVRKSTAEDAKWRPRETNLSLKVQVVSTCASKGGKVQLTAPRRPAFLSHESGSAMTSFINRPLASP